MSALFEDPAQLLQRPLSKQQYLVAIGVAWCFVTSLVVFFSLGLGSSTAASEIYLDHSSSVYPDWSKIHPRFTNTSRLSLKVELHHFTDKYNLIDIPFSKSEMLEVIQGVSDVWAQANIHINFVLGKSLKARKLSPQREDAYLYYTMVPKLRNVLQSNDTAILQMRDGFANWLSGGPLGETGAQSLMQVKSTAALLAWITGYFEREPWDIKNEVHIYLVQFYEKYNGYGSACGIFARAGACAKDVTFKSYFPQSLKDLIKNYDGHFETKKPTSYIDSTPYPDNIVEGIKDIGKDRAVADRWPPSEDRVKCMLGYKSETADEYGARDWELSKLNKDFLIRVISHEIGHKLGLPHPKDGGCIKYKTIEEANLMQQQRGVALKGGKCGKDVDANSESVKAMYLTPFQIDKARKAIMTYDVEPLRPEAYSKTVGYSMKTNPVAHKPTGSVTKIGAKTVVFLHLPVPHDGTVNRIRFRACGPLDTDPEVGGIVLFVGDHFTNGETEKIKIASTTTIVPGHSPKIRHHEIEVHLPVKKGQVLGFSFLEPAKVCVGQTRFPKAVTREDGVLTAGDMLKYHGEMQVDMKMFSRWNSDPNAKVIEGIEATDPNTVRNVHKRDSKWDNIETVLFQSTEYTLDSKESIGLSREGTLRVLQNDLKAMFNYDLAP